MSDTKLNTYECVVCGCEYNEAEGAPELGIAPGTIWSELPESFECKDCGVNKEDFALKYYGT